MKIKNLLFIALFLPVAFFSCQKDDDDKNKVKVIKDDPRIRSMYINKLSATFVINDVEGLIFNYDSLAYQTDISSLSPTFTGFGGTLSFQYKYGKNGEWKKYADNIYNPIYLNFDSVAGAKKIPVFFKSTAIDSSYTKEYEVDIRVHNYDVDAFEWGKEKVGTLPVQGTVVSQKAVFYNQKYYFFYRNDLGDSFVISSTDGETWKESTKISTDGLKWETLTTLYQPQKLVVQAGSGLYTCDLSENPAVFTSFTELPENIVLKAPLFTLGNNFWIIGKLAESTFLYSLANGGLLWQQGMELPGRVPAEKITTFVSPSGSTMLGYIFGGESITGNGTVWGIDVNGNIMELSQDQSVFPHLTYPMPVFFENKLSIVGGITDGNYTSRFYTSSNSGSNWSSDEHKTLPDKIGAIANGFITQYDRNKVILIGGETKNGFSPNVWKGTLKREILDGIISGK